MLIPGATLTLHLLVGSSGTSTSMESTLGSEDGRYRPGPGWGCPWRKQQMPWAEPLETHKVWGGVYRTEK